MKRAASQLILALITLLSTLFFVYPIVAAHTIEELKIIAEHGCVHSQYNLGVIYYGGIGVVPDIKEALS